MSAIFENDLSFLFLFEYKLLSLLYEPGDSVLDVLAESLSPIIDLFSVKYRN